MGLAHSPRIVTSGLVFSYDMNNCKKSWVGAPTSNRVVTIPYTLGAYAYCSGPTAVSVLDANHQPRLVNRYTISSAPGLVPRGRIVATGLTTGIDYAYTVKIKYNGHIASPSWHIDSSKGNPESNNNTFNSHTTSATAMGNGWYQLEERFNLATCPTGGAWSNFGLSIPDTSHDGKTFDAYDIQFEIGSFGTPYVTQSSGVRTNSECLIDLIGRNSITATALTYNSDNTFSFDGVNDQIAANWAGISTAAGSYTTVSMWMYWTGASNGFPMEFSSGYRLWMPSGYLGFNNGNGDCYGIDFNSYANKWTNVVAMFYYGTYTNNSKIYVNGNLQTLSQLVGTATSGGASAAGTIGGYALGAASYPFPGKIAQFSVYNRELTAVEVMQNFNAMRGRFGV